jgi:hypothetical protein
MHWLVESCHVSPHIRNPAFAVVVIVKVEGATERLCISPQRTTAPDMIGLEHAAQKHGVFLDVGRM